MQMSDGFEGDPLDISFHDEARGTRVHVVNKNNATKIDDLHPLLDRLGEQNNKCYAD
jgi:hypothetical protein